MNSYAEKSDEKMLVVRKNSNPKNYPTLRALANKKIIAGIRKYFLMHQEWAAELQEG